VVSRLVSVLAADLPRALKAIRSARAAARERVWALAGENTPGADGGLVTVDLGATIVIAPSPTVNEPGLGSLADGKGEDGVDRSFEWTGIPMYLGEQESSLERGEQGGGEVARVDAGREFLVGM
jgi:hypothetical protein